MTSGDYRCNQANIVASGYFRRKAAVRGLSGMRLPVAWRTALDKGHLLLLLPFEASQRRVTGELAERRNRFVAALSSGVFLAHAAPGSKTEELARQTLTWGKRVWTLDCPSNQHLLQLGVRPMTLSTRSPSA